MSNDSGSPPAPVVVHLCPPPPPEEFPRHGLICVGFGSATVTRDGDVVLDGGDIDGPEITGEDAEREAAKDPGHVWEIHLLAPLQERRYRREGGDIGRLVLVETGPGFA